MTKVKESITKEIVKMNAAGFDISGLWEMHKDWNAKNAKHVTIFQLMQHSYEKIKILWFSQKVCDTHNILLRIAYLHPNEPVSVLLEAIEDLPNHVQIDFK